MIGQAKFSSLLSALVLVASASAASKTAAPKAAAPKTAGSAVINDSWYTMQAGSTPWGHFHEVIELRDGKYSYRYSMTKVEKGGLYQENIGALADQDLTPIAFNLNKSGTGAIETTNAAYSKSPSGGMFTVEVQGAKSARFTRLVAPGTILDVFFPIWLLQRWEKLKPRYRGWLQTFAEDPERQEFRARTVNFEVKGMDDAAECLRIHVEMDVMKSEWCMNSKGALVDLAVAGFRVRRVGGEKEAKAFLAGVMPKPEKTE